MSTDSVKNKNANKQTDNESENNPTEVFVMPPNLLEKLGINLENIYSSTQSMVADEVEQDHISNHAADIDFNSSDPKIVRDDNDSILETANLMKESVFLSPTFISTDSNVISGEVEIAKIEADHKEFSASSTLQLSENSIAILENNKKITSLNLNCTSKDVEMNNVVMGYQYQRDLVQNGTISGMNDNLTGDHIQKCFQSTPIFSSNEVLNVKALDIQPDPIQADEHFISSDSSDYTNSNLVKINALTAIPQKTEPKKKVKILSEESVDSVKLKTLFSQSKNMLTPVSFNTFITKANDFSYSELEIKDRITNISLKNLNSSDLNDLNVLANKQGPSEEYDFSNNNAKLLIDNEFENQLQSGTSNKSEPCVLNKEPNNSHSNLAIDKTIESSNICNKKIPNDNQKNDNDSMISNNIDLYSKATDKQINENLFHEFSTDCNSFNKNEVKDSSDVDIDNKISIINEDEITSKDCSSATINTLQNTDIFTNKVNDSNKNNPADKVTEIATYLTSFYKFNNKKSKKMKNNNLRESDTKLSIQGVEKPGGPGRVSKKKLQFKNIKTYQRHCKTNKSVSSIMLQNNELKLNKLEFPKNVEEKITMKSSPVICKSRYFCKCSDFGQLTFYDCDEVYEHIHFMNTINVECNLDMLFSIYDDYSIYPNLHNVTEENNEEINSNDNIVLDFNICLNDITEPEDFLIDTNELILHMHNEDSKQVVCQTNTKVAYEVSSEEDYDDNNDNLIPDKDCIKEGDNVTKMLPTQQLENAATEHLESHIATGTTKVIKKKDKCSEMVDNVQNNMKLKTSDKEPPLQLENVSKTKLGPNVSHDTSKRITRNRKHNKEKEAVQNNTLTPDNSNRKRRISSIKTKKQDDKNNVISKIKAIKCGVCYKILQEFQWEDHISVDHCYVAWQDGATLDFETYLEDKVILNKINDKLRKEGTLMCTFCQVKLKRPSSFIKHVIKCYNDRKEELISHVSSIKTITCGVCELDMEVSSWMDHIAKAHDYLAWKKEETPLDLSNENSVWNHLNVISKDIEGLVCAKCGIVRKYVKQYLAHIKKCEGNPNDSIASLNTTQEIDTSKVQNKSVCENNLQVTRQRKHKSYYTKFKPDFNVMDSDTSNLNNDFSHNDNSLLDVSMEIQSIMVKCGVCGQEVDSAGWINHIQNEHNYVAWKDCEPPLDLSDNKKVKAYLSRVVSEIGCLTCSKCGATKKKPLLYLNHVESCKKMVKECNYDIVDSSTVSITETSNTDEPCECGVCSEKLIRKNWVEHAMEKHYNLAWIKGEIAYDLTNCNIVHSLLTKYRKQGGEMVCKSCGARKKSVLGFFSHIVRCGKTEKEQDAFHGKCDACDKKYLLINKDKHMATHLVKNAEIHRVVKIEKTDNADQNESNEADMYQCAVCLQKVRTKKWRYHVMSKHYNIAWMIGNPPLDINNPGLVDKLLKEYKAEYGKYICNICRTSKASSLGFYAHVLVCGKTDEETEQFKALCDICKKKYMRIYEYQHMRAHRDAEILREKKLISMQQKEILKETTMDHVEVFDSKRNRKAAEKAKDVIEKYTACNNSCDKCESTDVKCKCVKTKWEMNLSDSDASVHLDELGSESNHSNESDVDDNLSDEEERIQERRRKKQMESCQLKTQRIPFRVTSDKTYIEQSYTNFCKTHLTDEMLFDKWHNFVYEIVSESELEKYMPPLKESCKVQMSKSEWLTLLRFQAEKKIGGIFTGGSVQCMRWAPSRLDEYRSGHWLAVVAHLSADQPRYNVDELYSNPALIQLWNVGFFDTTLPKLALGLAHDYGTIWALDWCPSGARDPLLKSDPDAFEKPLRLGLLAVACSNGIVYIYSIPYPSTIAKDDNIFIKLKPTAELRLTDGKERKLYQATSVCWSSQKGHSHIIVGYADGTVAFYDVNTMSPLLKTSEGNIEAFSPYHDERFQNTSITGLDVYPGGQSGGPDESVAGAWCAAAVSAGAVRLGGTAWCPRAAHASLVTNGVVFSPHWPALLLAGDDALVTLVVNELELWGQGRRIGSVRAIAACQQCARVACFTPPFIRTMVTHPINKEIIKQIAAEIVLAPIGAKKNEKPSKDELTVKLEPKTYDEAITQYGVKIKPIDKSKLKTQNGIATPAKDVRPDRFPLADVTTLAFCTSAQFHDRLAVATHAGIVFFIRV
ncbi:hypothetical protein K1T71_002462 [Dendrolimus kikuchii]|uniref:Uncharacterized protein n=1 Tax=Dendrolimus kikuchii TaxID=765133 RepID=A0ACC1DD09_9NEOP|nr:hypothetical protein K1T71_002462 [Dendrolimus kikuchii]